MHAGSKQLWPDLLECSAPINSLYKGKISAFYQEIHTVR